MAAKVFFSYAHEDETFLEKLKKHLKLLERQGFIELWYDRKIEAGANWKNQIDQHLNSAEIILLLISSDFIKYDYCYSVEMKRALERELNGEARVIPIILRPILWDDAPLNKLQALPKDALPVTKWSDEDEAFLNIAEGIREIVKQAQSTPTSTTFTPSPSAYQTY